MPQVDFGFAMLTVMVPAMLFACWNDYRAHRIPNWLTAAMVVSGLAAQAAWFGWAGVQAGLLGVLVGFGMLILIWAMNGMGAGDVKYMAAMGAWLGPQMAFYAVIVGGLAGGVLALAMIAYQRRWFQAASNVGVLLTKVSSMRTAFSCFGSAETLSQSGGGVPYAIPLTIGSLVVWVSNYSGWWEVL